VCAPAGIQTETSDDSDEADGMNEALVTADARFITDNKLKELLGKLHRGVKLTFITGANSHSAHAHSVRAHSAHARSAHARSAHTHSVHAHSVYARSVHSRPGATPLGCSTLSTQMCSQSVEHEQFGRSVHCTSDILHDTHQLHPLSPT
jgi:hypothetical protein